MLCRVQQGVVVCRADVVAERRVRRGCPASSSTREGWLSAVMIVLAVLLVGT